MFPTSVIKLTFLGTRGHTDVRSEVHHVHSALLVEYYGEHVLWGCRGGFRRGRGAAEPIGELLSVRRLQE